MTTSLDDYCSACGYRKPPDAESCPDCGARFTPAAAPPAPAAASLAPAPPPPAPPSPPSVPAEPAAAAPDPPPSVPAEPSAAAAPGGRRFVSLFAVEAPPATGSPHAVPSAVPRRAAAAPPEEEAAPPPGYATVWPPVSAVRPAAPPPPPAEAAPAPEPAPAPKQPLPPAAPPPDMAAPRPVARLPWLSGRGLAIGGVVLAIVLIGVGLVLIPQGAPHRPRAAAALGTSTPTATATPAPPRGPSLAAQVVTLDALMRMSERGRAAAVKGDFAAAVANRVRLARRIGRLRAAADDAALRAGLGSFAAAMREALHQNRTCKAACSAADLARVGQLKQAALRRLNPLLRRYAHTSYRREQI